MKRVVLSVSAMLLVGAAGFAQGNLSNVNQVGNSDKSTVVQHGVLNKSDVDQLGNGNTSEVYQGVKPSQFYAGDNSAITMQKGNSNEAFISQSNYSNTATQTQTGNSNDATIWQDQVEGGFWGSPFGGALKGHDTATQTQTGNNNVATIDQGTTGNEMPTGAPFSADQINAVNGVNVPVSPSGYNNATQTQDGNWNVAYASQGGEENVSVQTQKSTSIFGLAKNVSNHYQYGNENEAYNTQDGIGLKNNTLQIGKENYANVMQTGSAHQNVTFQQGNNNISNVTQSGL